MYKLEVWEGKFNDKTDYMLKVSFGYYNIHNDWCEDNNNIILTITKNEFDCFVKNGIKKEVIPFY